MGAEQVALKANLASGASVYSNYFAVSHTSDLAADIEIKLDGKVLPATFEAAKESATSYANLSHANPAKLGSPVAYLNGKKLDVNAYNFKFRYNPVVLVHEYLDANGVDQQQYISCKDAVKGEFTVNPVYDSNDKESVNKAAIGKTPIVMVELLDANDDVVKRAYVKMTITVDREHELKPLPTIVEETLVTDDYKFSVSSQFINDNILEVIQTYEGLQSMTRDEFFATYDYQRYFISKNGEVFDHGTGGTVVVNPQGDPTQYNPYGGTVIFDKLQLAYGETADYTLVLVLKNKVATSSHPNYVSINVVFKAFKDYDTTWEAKLTYAAQRITFDLSADAIVNWAKALKDQPDTFNRIVEAAKLLADGQELNAIKALGGIPGFGVEEKVIVGVGRNDSKILAASAALTDWTEQYNALRKATEEKINQSGSDLDNLRKAIKILELAAKLDSNLQSTVDTLNTLYNVLSVAANYTAKVPTDLSEIFDVISFEEITLYE